MHSSESISLGLLALQVVSVLGFVWLWMTGHFSDLDRQARLPLDDGTIGEPRADERVPRAASAMHDARGR